MKAAQQTIHSNQTFLLSCGVMDITQFEITNPDIHSINFTNITERQTAFQANNAKRTREIENTKRKNEDDVKININAFKQPVQAVTDKFKDWRSDVSDLPDSTHLELINAYQYRLQKLTRDNLPKWEKKLQEEISKGVFSNTASFKDFFYNWSDAIKDNIYSLNSSLRSIDFNDKGFKTYIQLVAPNKDNREVKEFRKLMDDAMPNIKELDTIIDGRIHHFHNHIEPLLNKLEKEEYRKRVMDVRTWFSYKAEEFYKETNQKYKTYENMGQLSGGEKAQLTYTILGSAIAYQFGLTKEGLQTNAFRFIAIDEAFKAQDEDKARYLITLCKQLHLQLLVVTPSDNIHIVERDISYVHFVERKNEKYSWLYDMPIEQFQEAKAKYVTQ
jgi:uncharacterized protein YPO0396